MAGMRWVIVFMVALMFFLIFGGMVNSFRSVLRLVVILLMKLSKIHDLLLSE